MAKILSNVNIATGEVVEAHHISQSIDAFTGVEAYDITLSGSLSVEGPVNITGSLNANSFTGSLQGTASYSDQATTASYVNLVAGTDIVINQVNSSFEISSSVQSFPYTGSATISGSLEVTGSTDIYGSLTATSITSSLQGTASYATQALTSSHALSALTASYAISASYEINYETSSSYAETASYVPTGVGGLYGGDGTIPLNTTASVNGDLLFQGLDEDTKLTVRDGNGGSAIELFSDGNAGQASIRFIDPSNALIHQIQQAGGASRYVSNNRDLIFSTNTASFSEGITIQSSTGNVGIGTTTPNYILEAVQNTEKFSLDLDNSSGPLSILSSTNTNTLIRYSATDGVSSMNIGTVGTGWTGSIGFGYPGDTYIYSNSSANGINIISQTGTGTEDYIRLYAGGNPTNATASIHIHGTGSTKGYVGIGTETPQYNLDVNGTAFISGSSSGTVSGSSLTVYGTGSSNPVFLVNGSAGELFSISDSLSGSLFAVNNISGLPIFEVFSDDQILYGDSTAPALTTTVKNTVSATGAFTVYSIPTASYDGAWFEYVAKSGSNARTGQIMAVWSGSQSNISETTTTDIGSTTDLSFYGLVSGSNFVLTGSVATANWTVKTIVRSI